eukprot:3678595-Amphidinium_carterae.1
MHVPGKGAADKDKATKVRAVAATYRALTSDKEKHQFLCSFYKDCGPKGCMAGFLRTRLILREKQSQDAEEGYMTLGKVGDCLAVDVHMYQDPLEFHAAMLAEVEAYWAKHGIPPAEQVLNPEASRWCRKYFYKHDGTTHTTVESEQNTTMEKSMDMRSADAIGYQAIMNLDLQEPAPDVPVMTAAQALKLSKTRSASFKKLHEALVKKLQLCRKVYLTKRTDAPKAQVLRLESAETWCREHAWI